MDAQARDRLLQAIPYGLYAIGVRSGDRRNAFTANWLMQCSAEPVMLALAVENEGTSLPLLRESRAFSVNLYRADQRREAARLARPGTRAPAKLSEFATRDGATGAPLLVDTLGYLECRIVTEVPAGDHTLFLGEVVAAGVFREGDPLELHKAGFRYGG